MTKKIIRLLVVERTITEYSQILLHCGDVHRANGVECNLRRMTVLRSSPNETHCMRNGRYWWRIPFSQVWLLLWEADNTHNGHERVTAIVKEIGGVIEDRIRVGDRREDSQSLIVCFPNWLPVHSQWNTTESVVITMSRKCQLVMEQCSKGLGNSNTDRIERFVIGATSSSLKEPFSNIRYRLQLLAEETRELYRYRGDESTHASSMW